MLWVRRLAVENAKEMPFAGRFDVHEGVIVDVMGAVGQVGGCAHFDEGRLEGRRRGMGCEAGADDDEEDKVARDDDVSH